MRDTGLVSIITPTYNCARFIAETIESVQAQTYYNWEMIIVDDCSTDNTEEIVACYIADDPRIKYFRNDRNLGAALTRNRALCEATGRWIAFLDSDDVWKLEKLERQLRFMTDNGYAFTYHEYEEIDEDSRPLGITVSGISRVNRFMMKTCCWPGCLSVMYDAKKIGCVQIADIKKNNDTALWMKVIQKADCILLKENLALYRRRKGSITPTSTLVKLRWHYMLCRTCAGSSPVAAAIWTVMSIPGNALKKIFYVKKYN